MRTFVVERILEGKYIVKKDTWKTSQIFGKRSVSHLTRKLEYFMEGSFSSKI